MTLFEDRKRSFEARFAHDALVDFWANARCDRLVATWAAGLMGKSAEDSVLYADQVVRDHLRTPGPEALVKRLSNDLVGRADGPTIRNYMSHAMATARQQVMTELH